MKKRKPKYHIQPKLQDQAVWMSLSAVFLLFFITFISFSDHSTLTGSAVQNIAFMTAGSQFSAGVREIPGFEQYTLKLLETVKNGQIVVKENPTISFDRPFYAKFTISSDNPTKIGTVQLYLKLDEQLLLSKGISLGEVRVFHKGEEIDAILTKEEGRYLYYTATASGIGDFVIGKAAPKIEEMVVEPAASVEETSPEEPGLITTVIPKEEPAPLVGQAAAETEARQGFWVRIKAFFGQLFG